MKHFVITSVTLLAALSLTLVKPISTQASTWHSSAIPTKLRDYADTGTQQTTLVKAFIFTSILFTTAGKNP